MTRFVTKRVEVDAIKFTAETAEDVVQFTRDGVDPENATQTFNYGYDKSDGEYVLWGEVFDILHDTWIKVFEGQWIIRGLQGEYYPCAEETLFMKYEEVNE